MIIAGLQKTTLIDYPAKIAATVFLAGCNFKCPWCYSSELVLSKKIKKQPKISQKYFFDFLEQRQGLLEGIVVCGGEPTINKDLSNFIKKIKKMGFLVKLDTNGSNPKMLKNLLDNKLLDYIAMDIKAPFGQANIKKSVEMIKKSGIDYEFRTTVVPTIHSKEDILEIAREIGPAKKYFLQNFRPEKTLDPEFEKIKPYSEEFLEQIRKQISPLFEICEVR